MDLIQLQKYSDRTVSCPFASYRQNGRCVSIYIYIYSLRIRGHNAQYVYTYIRPRFHKLDYAYEASARDERASGSPKGDRAFKNDSPRSLPPPPFPSLPSRSLPRALSSSGILLLTRSCFFRGDRIRGLTDGESRSPLSVPRAPTWPISIRHSSHVSNVQVKHRVSTRDTKRYHRYR